QSGRVSLRKFTTIAGSDDFERLDGSRRVVVRDRIELPSECGREVVALAFGVGTVHDTDRTLEALALEHGGATRARAKIEHEVGDAGGVEERFVAVVDRRTHLHALRWRIPVGRRGNGALVRREPNRANALPVLLTRELTDVELPEVTHARRAGVADV